MAIINPFLFSRQNTNSNSRRMLFSFSSFLSLFSFIGYQLNTLWTDAKPRYVVSHWSMNYLCHELYIYIYYCYLFSREACCSSFSIWMNPKNLKSSSRKRKKYNHNHNDNKDKRRWRGNANCVAIWQRFTFRFDLMPQPNESSGRWASSRRFFRNE